MGSYPEISFDNTEFAFEHKSDKELKKARFLFSTMSRQWLVKLGTRLTPWAIKSGIPINGLIRNTIFSQFVGGETLGETAVVAKKLKELVVKYAIHELTIVTITSDFDDRKKSYRLLLENFND